MSYRAIYAYAWDLLDEGLPAAIAEIEALGLDTLTIAGSYHAGKFLRPHGRSGKVYFPEDGTVYFAPDPARYGTIRPAVNSLVSRHDVFRELASQSRLAVNAWLVLLHNSRLGAAHPDATVENAFGDRYVYSLCPSSPDARAYAIALCADITDRYPVTGISIETPGFLPYAHGYHHEFAMVPPGAWLDRRLGLCFCRHCLRGAQAAGVDATGLRARIREEVEGRLSGDLEIADDTPEAFWTGDIAERTDLAEYLRWRCGVVTSLVRAIRSAVRADATVAVIPSVARPTTGAWYEGSDLRALADTAGIVEACFYEPSVERVQADALDVVRRLNGTGRIRGILRPGYPDLQTRADVVRAAENLREAGISGLAFYNYGHLPRKNLAWIAGAVAAFGG